MDGFTPTGVCVLSIKENKLSFTEQDYNILSTRFITNLTPNERKEMSSAVQIFTTKAEAKALNMMKLKNLIYASSNPVPVTRIAAIHNCPQAAKGSKKDASGLAKNVLLSVGAKIMLKNNLWTERGLVNGTIGEVCDILFEKEHDNDRPFAIICKFPSYSGPYLDEHMKIISIPSICRSWQATDGTRCSRIQFPICISICNNCSQITGFDVGKGFHKSWEKRIYRWADIRCSFKV